MIILGYKIKEPPFETKTEAHWFMRLMRDDPHAAIVKIRLAGGVRVAEDELDQTLTGERPVIDKEYFDV